MLVAGIVLISSCSKDQLDPDMLNDLRFEPELEVPLVRASLSLADIVAKDTSGIFQVDPNNFITIKYKQEGLFQFSPNDLLEIPDQDPQEFPMIVGQPPIILNMALGTIGGAELGNVKFDKGKMHLVLESGNGPLSKDVEVKLVINNAQLGSQILTQKLTLSAGNSVVVDSVSLHNVIFDFTNGGQNINYISVGLEIFNPDSSLLGTPLKYSVQFKDLELDYATGYFGGREIGIPSGNFSFNLSGIEKLAGGFKIANPDLKLLIASNIGLPVQLAPDLDGINSANEVTSLGATPQLISGATDSSSFDTSAIVFDSQNSNILDFIASLPSTILYSGKAILNPAGHTMLNFISKNAAISASVDVELPLELSIDNSVLEQELTGIDIFNENPDEIEEFALIFRSSNGFPFELDISVAFLDQTTQDSIFGFNLGLLEPAQVSSDGTIISRGEYTDPREVIFKGADLDVLKNTNALRFRATLNTPGATPQKFFTHFDTEISIAARVKLKAEL